MKNLTILALCVFTMFSACKKKTEEPDVRDQYLGTWEGTWNTTVMSQTIVDIDLKDKIVITKTANTSNKITLTNASDATKIMTATLSANSITFDQFTRNLKDEGKTASGTFNGTGVFSGKYLSATGTLKYAKSGSTYDGGWNVTWTKQ